MSRFILINKPAGPTSHDLVDFLRQITGEQRIGHAGSLDPFAEGLLLLAIGRESTRQLNQFVGLDKEYVATIQLGATSSTYDKTGEIKKCQAAQCQVSEKEIKTALKKFVGEIEQIPPMFSAKKINGQKLYRLARQGKEMERKSNKIKIYDIELNEFNITNYQLQITISCSSGTYIRSLAHDLGETLGCGAYLQKLVRTKIDNYEIKNAISPDKITPANWSSFCFH